MHSLSPPLRHVVDYFAQLSTVGYGDLHPTNNASMMFTYGFSFLGISYLGIILGNVGHNIIEAELNSIEKARMKSRQHVMSFFERRHHLKPKLSSASLSFFYIPPSLHSHQSDDERSTSTADHPLEFSEGEQSWLESPSVIAHAKRMKRRQKCREMLSNCSKAIPLLLTVLLGSAVIAARSDWTWRDDWLWRLFASEFWHALVCLIFYSTCSRSCCRCSNGQMMGQSEGRHIWIWNEWMPTETAKFRS